MKTLLAIAIAAFTVAAQAETFVATSGFRNSANLVVTLNFADGGQAQYDPHVWCGYGGCVYGQGTVEYTLGDGSTFSGNANYDGAAQTFAGVDSNGIAVYGSMTWGFAYGKPCYRGCRLHFTGGSLTVN